MIFPGPFQSLPFCDSVICGLQRRSFRYRPEKSVSRLTNGMTALSGFCFIAAISYFRKSIVICHFSHALFNMLLHFPSHTHVFTPPNRPKSIYIHTHGQINGPLEWFQKKVGSASPSGVHSPLQITYILCPSVFPVLCQCAGPYRGMVLLWCCYSCGPERTWDQSNDLTALGTTPRVGSSNLEQGWGPTPYKPTLDQQYNTVDLLAIFSHPLSRAV